MANELYNDGQYIYINTPYAEAYIPDDIIEKPGKDPRPSSLAYDTGEYLSTIGIFYIRFFDDDTDIDTKRDRTKIRTLIYPNKIETRPSGDTEIKNLVINDIEDKYRIYKYEKGDILMEAASKKSYLNTEMMTKLVMSGKLPKSLTYDDLYFAWYESFQINGINPGIPPVLMQAIISKMCREINNPEVQFRFRAAKHKVDPRAYRMLSMNEVSARSSAMSGMAFERFSEKLTSSLIMSKEGLPQEPSPIEKLITI